VAEKKPFLESRMTQDNRTTLENLNWFYAQDEQAIGPVSFSELQGMVKAGQLAPETQIVEEGGQDWRPISDLLVFSPPMPSAAKPKRQISTARHVTGVGCLSLLMLMGIIAMLSPATKDEPGAIVENTPAAKETPPPQAPTAAIKPQPASDVLSDAQKEAYRKELLSIYQQLEALRPALTKRNDLNDMEGAARAGREHKAFRQTAIARVVQIKKEAESDFYGIRGAAIYIEGLWLKYLASDGAETATIRREKLVLADILEVPEVFSQRQRKDFEAIVEKSGESFTVENQTIHTLADMIVAVRGDKISRWHINGVLFRGDAIGASLVGYSEKHLFYLCKTQRGEPLVFALKRTSELEASFVQGSSDATALYQKLMRGEAGDSDPLKKGYVVADSDFVPKSEINTPLPSHVGIEVQLVRQVFLIGKEATTRPIHAPAINELQKPAAKTADGVVLKNSVLYADIETLKIMEAESEKGGDAGTRALERLNNAGKIWSLGRNLKVRVLERGGPMDALMVEAVESSEGLKAGRFWIMGLDLLPMNNPDAKWAMDKSKSVSKARFMHVLDGVNKCDIGGAVVMNFNELVAGLYDGAIPDATAKKCLALQGSIGGKKPCDFQHALEDYLIYEGVLTVREHFQFALIREPIFEEGYPSPAHLYEEIKGGGHHGGNPLYKGGLVYVGMGKFTLANGLVKMLPVFRVVNVLE
jgi:GYF domain 2